MTEDEYLMAQNNLYQKIASTLIEYTPETWSYIELILKHVVDENNNESLSHIISNPNLNNESIMAPEEIYEYTFALYDLFRDYKGPFKKALIKVYEVDGKWKFESDYEYA